MTIGWQEQLRPGVALREIVQQATAALVVMDAGRLEELALCCRDLNREEPCALAVEISTAEPRGDNDLRLLERVLYETRANLTVLSRLHAIRLREEASGQHAMSQPAAAVLRDWRNEEAGYGDN